MRSNGIILVRRIVNLVRHPAESVDDLALDWTLTYGDPDIVRRAIRSLAGAQTGDWRLRILGKTDPDHLLPSEHLTPDFQVMRTSRSRPATALVCFTGNALKLSIPVHLFHCAVSRRFDLLIYLRDCGRSGYLNGIEGLAGDLGDLIEVLRSRIPPGCRVAVIGTSGGGPAASRTAEALGAEKLALFSSPFRYSGTPAIGNAMTGGAPETKLFFSRNNKRDIQFARDWQGTVPGRTIEWLDVATHGTLGHLARMNRLESIVDWLASERETAGLPVRAVGK